MIFHGEKKGNGLSARGKKDYDSLKIEVVKFGKEDVIRTSGEGGLKWNDNWGLSPFDGTGE